MPLLLLLRRRRGGGGGGGRAGVLLFLSSSWGKGCVCVGIVGPRVREERGRRVGGTSGRWLMTLAPLHPTLPPLTMCWRFARLGLPSTSEDRVGAYIAVLPTYLPRYCEQLARWSCLRVSRLLHNRGTDGLGCGGEGGRVLNIKQESSPLGDVDHPRTGKTNEPALPPPPPPPPPHPPAWRWSHIADTAGRGDTMSCQRPRAFVPRFSSPLSPSSGSVKFPSPAPRGYVYVRLFGSALPLSLGSTPTAGDVPSTETRDMCCGVLPGRVRERCVVSAEVPTGVPPHTSKTAQGYPSSRPAPPGPTRGRWRKHDTATRRPAPRPPARTSPADGGFVRGVCGQRGLAASSSVLWFLWKRIA